MTPRARILDAHARLARLDLGLSVLAQSRAGIIVTLDAQKADLEKQRAAALADLARATEDEQRQRPEKVGCE